MEHPSDLKRYFKIVRIYHYAMTTFDLKYVVLVYLFVCLFIIYIPFNEYLRQQKHVLFVGGGITCCLYFSLY